MRKFLITLIASCACSVMAATQTDIYVSPRGDDSAPGTIDVIANSNPDVDLRPNDVILSVDNTDTDDTAALEKALKAKKTGSHAEAVRVRNQSAEKMRIRITDNQ